VSISFELPKLPPFTAEEYETLVAPEGMRLELMNGSLDVAAAAQMGWHYRTAQRIGLLLGADREVLGETGVVLAPGTVRVPDVTRFREGVAPDLLRSQYPAGDVDLVVEVISPESDERDRVVKPLEYARAGIAELWLVERDAETRTGAIITVFRLALQTAGTRYELVRRASLDDLEKEG
jgi:Uma2 family endonuclease